MIKNHCKQKKFLQQYIPFVESFILVKNNPVNPADCKI